MVGGLAVEVIGEEEEAIGARPEIFDNPSTCVCRYCTFHACKYNSVYLLYIYPVSTLYAFVFGYIISFTPRKSD
jgi:hypothetical protein